MRVVWIDVTSGPRLEDGTDFTAFSVETPEGLPLRELAPDLVVATDSTGDREEVGVSADLVRTLAGSPPADDPWTTAFDAMLHAVEKFGWYDETSGLILAHVVHR